MEVSRCGGSMKGVAARRCGGSIKTQRRGGMEERRFDECAATWRYGGLEMQRRAAGVSNIKACRLGEMWNATREEGVNNLWATEIRSSGVNAPRVFATGGI